MRGRSWIPILGLLLTGIVAMQVETLRLSASTGRSLERVTALQSLNQQLQASVAVLADDQRIERLAAGMNMVMPGPTQVRFLAARGGSVSQALGAVHTPNGSAFLAALPPTAGAGASAGSATTLPASGAAAPVASAAVAPAAPASAPPASTPAAGATAPGVPSSSAGGVPTATSDTNTGVASTGSNAATSPAAPSGAPAAVTPAPTATTPNGAAGVTAGG